MIIILIIGVVLGIVLGLYIPIVPQAYVKLLSVALMASLDTVFGGIRAVKEIGRASCRERV